jgi:hypothetical protein
MTLSHRIAEVQRTVAQLEDEAAEVADYPERTRTEAAMALSDLAVRLELVRLTMLSPGSDEPEPAA